MKETNSKAIVCVLLAAILFGLSSPFSKLLLNDMPPAVMASFLYIGAGIGMFFVNLIKSRDNEISGKIPQNDYLYIVFIIILNVIALIMFIIGLSKTTATNATLLNNFEIVATYIIAYWISKESIDKRMWIGIILITFSSTLLFIEDLSSLTFSFGSIFILIACLCLGLENNCMKILSNNNPFKIIVIKALGSGIGSLIIAIMLKERPGSLKSSLLALLLGFLSYGLSIYFYTKAKQTLGTTQTGVYYAIATFVGVIISLIIFKIPITLLLLMAPIIMIIGVHVAFKNNLQGHQHRDDIISIDHYAYTSNISGWNPTLKVVLSIVLAIFSISTNSIIIPIIITIAMLWLTVFKGGIDFNYYLKLLLVPLGFAVLSCIAIAFDLSNEPIGDFNIEIFSFYITATQSSINHVLLIMTKALGSISCMYMMSLSTPSYEVIGVLQKAKVPSIVIELMNIIYRYIFILMEVQNRMNTSAKSRLGYCDMKTAYYSFASIATNLLVVSFKKASIYFDAIESRCYDGELKFLAEEKPLKMKHSVIASVFVFLLFIIFILTR